MFSAVKPLCIGLTLALILGQWDLNAQSTLPPNRYLPDYLNSRWEETYELPVGNQLLYRAVWYRLLKGGGNGPLADLFQQPNKNSFIYPPVVPQGTMQINYYPSDDKSAAPGAVDKDIETLNHYDITTTATNSEFWRRRFAGLLNQEQVDQSVFEVRKPWGQIPDNWLTDRESGMLLNIPEARIERGDIVRLNPPYSENFYVLIYDDWEFSLGDLKLGSSGNAKPKSRQTKTVLLPGSRFYFPMWWRGREEIRLKNWQWNSFPPHLTSEMTQVLSKTKNGKEYLRKSQKGGKKPQFSEHSLQRMKFLQSRIPGLLGGRHIRYKGWTQKEWQIQILRWRGNNRTRRRRIDTDIALAIRMCDISARMLNRPRIPPEVEQLFQYCFGSGDLDVPLRDGKSDPAVRRRVARFYQSFARDLARVDFVFDGTDRDNLAYVDSTYFSRIHITPAHLGMDVASFRAATVIHEYAHCCGMLGHPGTGNYDADMMRYVDKSPKTKRELWRHLNQSNVAGFLNQDDESVSGLPHYIRVMNVRAGPKNGEFFWDGEYGRTIFREEALINPYCYELFATWLCEYEIDDDPVFEH